MDEEDALIDKAQNLSDRIYALDKMGKTPKQEKSMTTRPKEYER